MEFKKLSDVEVVAEPAESANVLIEENGVIKKAPKTAIGGAGSDCIMICHHVDTNTVIVSNNIYQILKERLFDDFVGVNCIYWIKEGTALNSYCFDNVSLQSNDNIRIIALGRYYDIKPDSSVGNFGYFD
jgi:hypothetical protein